MWQQVARGNIQQTSYMYISQTGQHSPFKLMLLMGRVKTVCNLEVHVSLITWNCPIQLTTQFLTNNGFPNSSNLIHASAQNHSSVVTCNGCCMNHLDTCLHIVDTCFVRLHRKLCLSCTKSTSKSCQHLMVCASLFYLSSPCVCVGRLSGCHEMKWSALPGCSTLNRCLKWKMGWA